MINLHQKIALVTGSSRGIGKASALALAAAGADVLVNYVTSRSAALETALEIRKLGRRAWVVRADVSEEEDVEQMMEFIESEIGRLNIIVSNAATGGFRNLLDSRAKHFEHAMNINVMATIYLARRARALLTAGPDRGKIIALTSHGSEIALPMYGLIGGSKAALESVCRHLTLELGPEGVNINLVKAGLVETDSTRRLPGAELMFAGRTQKSMMGERVLEDTDVANAVLFLASPLSDLVQGQVITVDGGSSIHV